VPTITVLQSFQGCLKFGQLVTQENGTNIAPDLIEQWNGTAWTAKTGANPTPSDTLDGVYADSTTDAWAVGSMNSQTSSLIEHWNGTSWSVVSSPK
jgi:hypothetical protein